MELDLDGSAQLWTGITSVPIRRTTTVHQMLLALMTVSATTVNVNLDLPTHQGPILLDESVNKMSVPLSAVKAVQLTQRAAVLLVIRIVRAHKAIPK